MPHRRNLSSKLLPITGRSHQLRVHLMAIGHAIVGDEFYASEDLRRSRALSDGASAKPMVLAPHTLGAVSSIGVGRFRAKTGSA